MINQNNKEKEFFLNENVKKIRIEKGDEDFFLVHDTYEPSYLSNLITRKQYDDIITEAEKIMCFSAIKKQQFEKVEINLWINLLLILTIFLFILFIIFLSTAPRQKKHNKTLYYFSIGFVSLGIFILIIVEIYNNVKKIERGKTLNDFIIKDMKKYCKNVNKNINKNLSFYYDRDEEILICEVKLKDNQEINLIDDKENQIEKHKEKKIKFNIIDNNKNK